MNQWLNFSHPQTLQAGVFLGYLSAVFGVIFGSGGLGNPIPPFILLVIFLAMGIGAFFTANNRRWGYQVLAVTASIIAVTDIAGIALAILDSTSVSTILLLVNNAVFPVALAAAVLHAHSREYQRIWFE
jgi:hypothetical protein